MTFAAKDGRRYPCQ
ncbi:hypothetical protein ACWAT4_00895 [Bradyrhizobium manausense]